MGKAPVIKHHKLKNKVTTQHYDKLPVIPAWMPESSSHGW